jgi:hypothetical protein
MDRRTLLSMISIVFSISTGVLVLIGSLVMMYGNFDLGVILFVLGLLLVISNEGLIPKIRLINMKDNFGLDGTLEEIVNLAILGYTPPVLITIYLWFSKDFDPKLVIFLGVCFVLVTLKIFAKFASTKIVYKPLEEEEIYIYNPKRAEELNEPGI